MTVKKKKKWVSVFVLLCVLFCLSLYLTAEYYSDRYAENILRFHVIANSDTAEDQALKIKVRDAVGCKISSLAKNVNTAAETAAVVREHSEEIKCAAEECIKKEGYEYGVEIKVGEYYFPTKHYQAMALPAGDYEAVRIIIGEGKGENWWCVLFPPLCFSNGNAVENDASDKKTTQEKFSFKFKIVELFQEIKHCFQKKH